MKKIAFISCVKTKTKLPSKAEDLYISDLFKKSLEYCKKRYDEVFILSAKYGLLSLNDFIKPYELTLNKMTVLERKQWSYKVYMQIEKKIGLQNEFYFYCGKNYNQFLKNKLNGKNPLEGLTFGNQLKFYKNNL
jgi:cytoplasmic iron level regulating protein YaaA (DUF328/UPF0246 family)